MFEDKINLVCKAIRETREYAVAQALSAYKSKLRKAWNERVEEVKQGLDEEYGVMHSFTPNYEGIFDALLKDL